MPDGICLRVCASCVDGLRRVEQMQSAAAAVVESKSPQQQIKELKIKQMMLSGQVGSLQRAVDGGTASGLFALFFLFSFFFLLGGLFGDLLYTRVQLINSCCLFVCV